MYGKDNPKLHVRYIGFYTIHRVKQLSVFLLVNTSGQSHQIGPIFGGKDLFSFRPIAP